MDSLCTTSDTVHPISVQVLTSLHKINFLMFFFFLNIYLSKTAIYFNGTSKLGHHVSNDIGVIYLRVNS